MFCWKWEQKTRLDEEEVAIVMEIAEVIEKHIVLQRLMNCSMQELLLLQID